MRITSLPLGTICMLAAFGSACLLTAFGSASAAENSMHWQPSLEVAQRTALQSKRLVLIHFWAPWCAPCMSLEQTVFAQPETATALDPNFVMVKLNADDSRATARMYQVTTLPTDVIITPDGRLVAAISSPAVATEYIAKMNQAAAGFARLSQTSNPGAAANPYGAIQAPPAAVAAAPQNTALQNGGPQYPAAQNTPAQGAPYGASAPGQVDGGQTSYSAYAQQPPAGAAVVQGTPGQLPSWQTPVATAGLPPDALDGYCAVTLIEEKRWVKGDVRFGAIHRGRTYKFATQEAQRRFLANPDGFSPVAQGNDPVLALDARQTVAGRRDHGLFYQNRIYLFSSEESLKQFQAAPNRYAAEIVQAMR